ncbi:MAG: hypothetical protein ACFFG0_15270 [Candidatus Thorarchaeota archaeon]
MKPKIIIKFNKKDKMILYPDIINFIIKNTRSTKRGDLKQVKETLEIDIRNIISDN